MSTAVAPVIHVSSTKPVAPVADAGKKGEIRICSVYPLEKSAERRHKLYTKYVLPAAPRDAYSLCIVFDTYEAISTWNENPTGKEQHITPGHIPVQVVADDLVSSWSHQTIASQKGHGPGIGQIKGDEPTEAELAHLRERQRAFFEWCIQDGNDKHLSGEQKNITHIHRCAALWLLGEAAQQLSWYPKMEQRTVKNCPRCAKQILEAALGCEHCSLDLIDWYTKYPNRKPDKFVALFLEEQRQAAMPVEPPTQAKSKEPRQVQP